MNGPPIVLSHWERRKVWLSETLTCPECGSVAHGSSSQAGDLWLTCQMETKRTKCRAHWRAITLRPGAIGGTFAALFGYRQGRKLLNSVKPDTAGLEDDDLWSVELGERTQYLQIALTLEEYLATRGDWKRASRVLRALLNDGEAA